MSIDGSFCLHAFGNFGFGGICQVKFVVGGFGLVAICRLNGCYVQFAAGFGADGGFIGMNGISGLVARNGRSNVGIVACCNHAGFFAVSNSLVDGVGNAFCGGKFITVFVSRNRTAVYA